MQALRTTAYITGFNATDTNKKNVIQIRLGHKPARSKKKLTSAL